MTLVELKRLIAHNGFLPVPIVLHSDDSSQNPRFEGDLNEFWQAAKALGAKTVFLQAQRLIESDFQRPKRGAVAGANAGSGRVHMSGMISLEEHLPRINLFRKHIGREGSFILSARSSNSNLDFLIQEDWWVDFLKAADEAHALGPNANA